MSMLSVSLLCRGGSVVVPWRPRSPRDPVARSRPARSVHVAGQKVSFDLATPAQIRDVLERYRDAGGRVEIEMFEGSGHFPAIDAAQRWSELFFTFLASVD